MGACPRKQHYSKQGAPLRSKGIEHGADRGECFVAQFSIPGYTILCPSNFRKEVGYERLEPAEKRHGRSA